MASPAKKYTVSHYVPGAVYVHYKGAEFPIISHRSFSQLGNCELFVLISGGQMVLSDREMLFGDTRYIGNRGKYVGLNGSYIYGYSCRFSNKLFRFVRS